MAELIQIRDTRQQPEGTALFDVGLRPFFLGAGLFATLSLLWWIAVYGGVLSSASGWPPHWQHAHEMVFGFGAAAVAGFLLTASANWTSTAPLSGAPLSALFVTWVLGRLAFVVPGLPVMLVAVVDSAFLPALLLALWPALRAGKRKNLVFAFWLLELSVANVVCHLEVVGHVAGVMGVALRAGVYGLVMMVAILSGRVVPGFTQNALRRAGRPAETRTHPWIELGAKAATLCAFAADVFGLPAPVVAALALLAGLLLAARMIGWRTWQILDEPIVWILHVAHGLLVLAMFCMALEHVTDLFAGSTALHLFTAGVVGTMVLGIMSRASLGHTGRPLRVSRVTVLSYLLVIGGALLRAVGPLAAPEAYQGLALAGGASWALGYGIFTAVYAPILLGPRADAEAL